MPYLSIASRSTPVPKAKPCHSSGSSPQAAMTRGWTMPLPSTSIQPSLPPTTRRPFSIDQPTSELRAGLTAAVTVKCAEFPDVLQVPVQAMYAHGSKFYCFVYDRGRWEAREVKPGPTNDKFFVIESGLNEGDKIALNPRAHLDEVTLPKLSPEEAQRAVPQRPTSDLEAGGTTGGQQPGGMQRGGPGARPGGPSQGPRQPGQLSA